MSNNTQIISRPIKSGCNFNACNPIIYRLRREDFQFNQINNDGGNAQIQINAIDLTAYFEDGNQVYIQGIGTVEITASAYSGGNTLLTIGYPFSATSSGYINNNSKRADYKVEVEIFDFETNLALGPRLIHDPGEDGEIKADISGIVKTFLHAEWSDPVVVNVPEEETFKKVYIKYQEFYNVTYWDLVNDVANPVVAVFAFIPLLLGTPPDFSRYPHGGNLLLFYPEDENREWLVRFSPTLWRGWPLSLSFIWGNHSDINRRVVQIDSQGGELSDTITALTPDLDKIHRMTLGDINALATELRVTLEDGSASVAEQILAELTVKVVDPCPSQVLLFWKNTLGGDAFWMFDESQDYEFVYPSGRKVKRMKLFADNLLIKEWEGINELNSSTDVINLNIVDYGMDDSINKTHFRNDNQVYIINQDGTKVGVIVVARDRDTKTIYKKHSIEITIELPEIFTV
jgi:hypothetical protein